MHSISQVKEINELINELRSKGFSRLDMYLVLKTIRPDMNFDYLLTPSELELINRLNRLKGELYRIRTMLNEIERRVRRRHELIAGIYEELMDNSHVK